MAIVRIKPPNGGLQLGRSADYLSDTEARVAQNLLLDRKGEAAMRGKIIGVPHFWSAGSGSTSTTQAHGGWVYDDTILFTIQRQNSGGVYNLYRRRYVQPGTGATENYTLNIETGSTAVPVSSGFGVGGSYARLGNKVYGFSTTGTDIGGVRATTLLKWDGNLAVDAVDLGGTPWSNAARGGVDIAAYQDRLFILAGFKPGTSTFSPNSLFWSDQKGPVAGTLAAWQDDVSGLTNEIIVGSDDANDFGVGLARLSRSLVIFKNRSIHALIGDTVSSYAIRPISQELGAVNSASIVEYGEGCFFMSHRGFMYYDGNSINHVGEPISAELDTTSVIALATKVTLLNDDFLLLANNSRTWVLHIPSGAWSEWLSETADPSAPAAYVPLVDGQGVVGRTLERPFAVMKNRVYDLTYTTKRQANSGVATGWEDVDAFTGNKPTYIPTQWYSGLIRLTSPLQKAVIRRIMVDYNFVLPSPAPSPYAWFVELRDGRQNVLLPAVRLAHDEIVAFPLTTQHERKRAQIDCNVETDDVQLRVYFQGEYDPVTHLPLDARLVNQAQVFDVYLEYEPAQRPSST